MIAPPTQADRGPRPLRPLRGCEIQDPGVVEEAAAKATTRKKTTKKTTRKTKKKVAKKTPTKKKATRKKAPARSGGDA